MQAVSNINLKPQSSVVSVPSIAAVPVGKWIISRMKPLTNIRSPLGILGVACNLQGGDDLNQTI